MIPTTAVLKHFEERGCETAMLVPGRESRMVDFATTHEIPSITLRSQSRDEVVREMMSAIERYAPDITLCDWQLEFWVALRAFRPRCTISILRCELLKGYKRINTALTAKVSSHDTRFLDLVNRTLDSLSAMRIQSIEELYSGDVIAVPSVPQLDPVPTPVDDIYAASTIVHTGPLTLDENDAPLSPDVRSWMEDHRRNGRPVVLVTLGTAVPGDIYVELVCGLARGGLASVITVPRPEVREALKAHEGEDTLVLGFSPLRELMAHCDVVLHHGGHATTLLAIEAAKPSLILPTGEYDREDNAVRVERLHAGRLLESVIFRGGVDGAALTRRVTEIVRDPTVTDATETMSNVVRDYRARVGAGALLDIALQRLG